MNLTDAFSKFNATLVNTQWAFSAIAEDGALVVSCWQHKFSSPGRGVFQYVDRISRFPDHKHGKTLLITHLQKALDEELPVRLVVVSTKDTDIVDSGGDASKIRKEFDVKPKMVGRVLSFDGDAFVIEYRSVESTNRTGTL